jgi:hypothetical protein
MSASTIGHFEEVMLCVLVPSKKRFNDAIAFETMQSAHPHQSRV